MHMEGVFAVYTRELGINCMTLIDGQANNTINTEMSYPTPQSANVPPNTTVEPEDRIRPKNMTLQVLWQPVPVSFKISYRTWMGYIHLQEARAAFISHQTPFKQCSSTSCR